MVDELAGDLNAFIQTRESEFENEELDLAELFEEVRDRAAAQLDAHDVIWRQELATNRVYADRLALTRALTNVVDNALKYGGSSLSRLDIGCKAGPEFHHLWVADDGVGVAAEEREQVFCLFRRGTGSRGQPGTGLGLAVVSETARRHGGEAWLE